MPVCSIGDLLARQSNLYPARPAIAGLCQSTLTYAGLLDQSTAVRFHLSALGLGRGDRIAVVLPNGPEMAAAFVSIAATATCAPLNPAYRESEFEFYLKDLGAKALVVHDSADSPAVTAAIRLGIPVLRLRPLSGNVAGTFTLNSDSSNPEAANRSGPKGWARPDDIALVLHTSGTTARPKIVPLTQANVMASAHNVAASLELTPDDRCLNIMPLFHIHGLIGALLSSLATGSAVCCTPGFSSPDFFPWLKSSQPTWYTAVPTMHQAILARAAQDGIASVGNTCRLRLVRSSSASLTPQVMAALEELFRAPVLEAYGMTEAAHQMACNPLPPKARKPASVGLPAGPEIAIMSEDGRMCESGRTGEVVIRGSNVTPGYENNPDANKSSFTNGWFRTGDQGYLDGDGYLFLTGRLKELINRGGEKISPREIDEALLDHPAVAQAVAFGAPHPRLGEEVNAVVVLHPDSRSLDHKTLERQLREFASIRLADFKVPVRILFVDEIPKGPTGKVQRIGLAAVLGVESSVGQSDYRPEDTETTTQPENRSPVLDEVLALCREILAVDHVGSQDNFFALGGDSLLAGRLLAQLESHCNVRLSLIGLFETPTPAGIAQAVIEECGRQCTNTGADNEIERLIAEMELLSDEEAQERLSLSSITD